MEREAIMSDEYCYQSQRAFYLGIWRLRGIRVLKEGQKGRILIMCFNGAL